jgi:hypothetical protein
MKIYTLEEMIDKHIGKRGTPNREDFEKKIKINMKIKEGWHEISIKEYIELANIEEQETDNITGYIKRIAILADVDPDDIRDLPINEFRELQKEISWVFDNPDTVETLRFEIDGVRYGMIPNLQEISAGEYIDIEMLKQNDDIGNLHKILAVIYREITWEDDKEWTIVKHDLKGFEKRSKIFYEKVSIETVYFSLCFFLSSGTEFMKIFHHYLDNHHPPLKKKPKTPSRTRKNKP